MSKFFQNEIAAYAGDKNGLRNAKFKKRNFENTAGAEAGTLLEIIPLHIKNPPVIPLSHSIETGLCEETTPNMIYALQSEDVFC